MYLDLLAIPPPIPLPEPQVDVASLSFFKEQITQFSSGEDAHAFYFTRENLCSYVTATTCEKQHSGCETLAT